MLDFMLYYIVGNITIAIVAFITVMWVGTVMDIIVFKTSFKNAMLDCLQLVKEMALGYIIIVQPFIIWIVLSSW